MIYIPIYFLCQPPSLYQSVAISFSKGSSWPRDRNPVSQVDSLLSEPPGEPLYRGKDL